MSYVTSTVTGSVPNLNMKLVGAIVSQYASNTSQYGTAGLLGGTIESLTSWESASSVQSQVSAFLNAEGAPWVQIGSVSAIPQSGNPGPFYIVAINLDQAITFTDNGSGLTFGLTYAGNQVASAGYAPYASGSAAITALLGLAGKVASFS